MVCCIHFHDRYTAHLDMFFAGTQLTLTALSATVMGIAKRILADNPSKTDDSYNNNLLSISYIGLGMTILSAFVTSLFLIKLYNQAECRRGRSSDGHFIQYQQDEEAGYLDDDYHSNIL